MVLVKRRRSIPSSSNHHNERGLWRGHPATERQARLASGAAETKKPPRPQRMTQADLILGLLRQARAAGEPLQLAAILQTNIAQYCARLAELRERGRRITNRTKHDEDGHVLSEYVLVFDAERDDDPSPASGKRRQSPATAPQGKLFANLAQHRDEG
jgi:hypothetical protein